MKTYAYMRVSTQRQKIERQETNIKKQYARDNDITDIEKAWEKNVKVYKEKYTGTSNDRPMWQALIKSVKPGDVIYFDSVSRMSRNAQEGMSDYEQLYNMGVTLIFLNEPSINTSVFKDRLQANIESVQTGDEKTDKLLNTIIQALQDYTIDLAKAQVFEAFIQAEKEVNDLKDRTKGGIAEAHKRGSVSGRRTGTSVTTQKSIHVKQIILERSKSFNGVDSDSKVIQYINGDKNPKNHVSRNSYYKYKTAMKQGEAVAKLKGNKTIYSLSIN